MNTEIKKFEPVKVVSLLHTGPVADCTPTWDELYKRTGTTGDTAETIGIVYDDPRLVDASKLRYDACVSVDVGYVAKEPLELKTIKGGEYLVAVHKGAFSGLAAVYKELYENKLPELNRKAAGSPVQVYLNNPKKVAEDEILTEIRIPLA